MAVHRIDPIHDARWATLVAEHADASVFHSVGWLRALRATYRFQPTALTTAGPGEPLRDGLVLCRVDSRLTGHRLVSVPFADHCQPLWRSSADAVALAEAAADDGEGFRYVELRPRRGADAALEHAGFARSARYLLHAIDLEPSLEELRSATHKRAVRQMVGRADREGVTVRRGNDEALRADFYRLLLKTRRKHGLPPQPRLWFTNLGRELGSAVTFHVARHDGQPVAAIATTTFRDVHCHKYGCSDPAASHLGGTQLLLWQAIEAAKADGAHSFDMGRTDPHHEGLRRFKQRWGAAEHPLEYLRSPGPSRPPEQRERGTAIAGHVFSRMPDGLLAAAGRHLYRHVG